MACVKYAKSPTAAPLLALIDQGPTPPSCAQDASSTFVTSRASHCPSPEISAEAIPPTTSFQACEP
jgi:hypothetical protein